MRKKEPSPNAALDSAAEDRLRMRRLIALAAVLTLTSCKLSLDATLAPLDCTNSSNQHNSSCSTGGRGAGGIVIVVLPSRQYSDAADALCYQVSPVAASVAVGGTYSFQNTTNSTVTIQGSNQSTWATVAPGETSAALNVTSAGSYSFGVQGCRGMAGTPWYGQLSVTP
jgi:hypothetical protein